MHMADAWIDQLGQHGPAWTVPPGKITEFSAHHAALKTLFAEVKSGERTPVNTERCRVMFREEELLMRFLKDNFFNMPPRTSDELAALLLSVHDGHPTPVPLPEVSPGLGLHNTGGHGIQARLFLDAEPGDRRSADHFFAKWGLKPQGRWATTEEAAADPRLLTRPPARAGDLPMHFSTGRKTHVLDFSLADIGMELYATVCWQTPRNQDGPYCTIVSKLIS
jgi:hypothetical protein